MSGSLGAVLLDFCSGGLGVDAVQVPPDLVEARGIHPTRIACSVQEIDFWGREGRGRGWKEDHEIMIDCDYRPIRKIKTKFQPWEGFPGISALA